VVGLEGLVGLEDRRIRLGGLVGVTLFDRMDGGYGMVQWRERTQESMEYRKIMSYDYTKRCMNK